MKINIEAIEQLNEWAERGLSVRDTELKSSEFYRDIHINSSLFVNRTALTPSAFVLLAYIVATSKTLTYLDVSYNDMSECAEEFGIAVSLSESVSHLNMCGNNITEHAELFGVAIASSESITHLNVSGNNMGRHAIAFGDAISNSKSITNLVMDCNNIGEYAGEFGWCVARSTALKSLYMYDNNILNAEVFGNAIASSRALIHLYLCPQDAKSFGRSIAHAASLKSIEGMQDLFLEAQACQNAEQCAIQSQLIYFLPLPVSSIVVEYLGNLLDVFDAEGS